MIRKKTGCRCPDRDGKGDCESGGRVVGISQGLTSVALFVLSLLHLDTVGVFVHPGPPTANHGTIF